MEGKHLVSRLISSDQLNCSKFSSDFFIVEFLSEIKEEYFHFKSIFLKSSLDIAGCVDVGVFASLLAAAFWTDVGTKEILDFCSVFAGYAFLAPLKLETFERLTAGFLSVGGAEIATVKTLSMYSF